MKSDEPSSLLTEVVMASANPHKVTEIESLLRLTLPNLRVLPRPPEVGEVVEDADTLLGNARLKAHALAAATGKPAVADDTGLFVDALGGDPGVHTARYAGENATYSDNCKKLLSELARVGATTAAQRTASFVTVAIVAWPDGRETWAEGRVDGIIMSEAHGADGFGYDPVFAPVINDSAGPMSQMSNVNYAGNSPGVSMSFKTFAELGGAVKNTISHRSRAFAALAVLLSI